MSFADSLTPKDTEEIKPGLFIQKKGGRYRQISPVAWQGKIRWKEQLRSVITLRGILWIAIILFLVYGYQHDNSALIDFYNSVHEDPVLFCNNILTWSSTEVCTEEYERQGLCIRNFGTDLSSVKFLNETNTSNLS